MYLRGVFRRSLSALFGALVLTGLLLSVLHAQSDAIVIDGEDACAAVGGTWDSTEATCSMAELQVELTTLSVPPTVTLAVSETFGNGDLRTTMLFPNLWEISFFTGTTEISGTLISTGAGENSDRLINDGVLRLDGDFSNLHSVAAFCSRLPPYPATCSLSPHSAYLHNVARMLVFGHLYNEARIENGGELVIADAAGGTIPPPPQHVTAAGLAEIDVDEALAQVVNEGILQNDGVIENLGTVYVKYDLGLVQEGGGSGVFVNDGLVNNYAALVCEVETHLDNAGTISNTGLLLLEGVTLNAGRIVGDGALVNRGDFVNIGLLDGLIYNEGRIFNAGIIDGSVLGPGELIELDQHQYLPLATAPGGS